MTNTREERVQRAIAPELVKYGPDYVGRVARAAIAAYEVEPSPDVWEAIEGARLLADLLMNHDHKRRCQGREYVCSCGYDKTVYEAAKLLQGALPDPPKVTVEEDKR